MKSLRVILRLGVSLGVSLIIMGLLWRLLGNESSHSNVWDAFTHASRISILAYVVLSLLQAYVRAIRFRVLIIVDKTVSVPGTLHIFFVSMVRNMLVDLLPARSGELFYIAMMNRGYRIPGNLCVSSLTISFVFDLIALVFMILILTLWQLLAGDLHAQVLMLLIVVAIVVGIVSVLLFAGIAPAVILARKFLGRHAEKMVFARLLSFAEKLNESIALARSGGVLLKVFLLSMIVRFIKYSSLYLLFKGVVSASYPALVQASPVQILFALVGGEAGASLAVPTLMGFGTYEAGSAFALSLFGFPVAAAVVSMFVVHIWSQCVDYTLGGLAFVLFTFCAPGSRDLAHARQPKKLVPLFVSALCVIALGLGLLALQWRSTKKSGSKTAPPPGQAIPIPADEEAKRQQVTAGLNGFVVWSSNRSGQHDLYRCDLPKLNVRRLTTHPHVDTYPRIAPDGKQVVFARSQKPWVSQRNVSEWDIYLLDLENGRERLLATNGYTPTWSSDGKIVWFQRGPTAIVEHRLASGHERVGFSVEKASLPERTIFYTPAPSGRDDRMAVKVRGDIRGNLIMDADGQFRRISGGCQPNWGPGDAFLYYIDHGGRGKNLVWRADPSTGERTRWLDLAGDYSHEYFPRVSSDGRYLVLGASAEGHEHDVADYEIFLWEIGQPSESVARLTHHAGNDCWPDIYLEPAPATTTSEP